MWPYWLMFLLPSAVALGGGWLSPQSRLSRRIYRPTYAWLVVIAALTLFIGYRYQVGGDWGSYIAHFQSQSWLDLWDVLSGSDPGYYLINWWFVRNGGDIYAINLVCGLIGAVGVAVFSRTQPRPWLAMAVAIPYLVNVVMMGYTRQGAALGIGMIGIAALLRDRPRQFIIWALLAATFHKSAVVLLPLAVLGRSRNRLVTGAGVAGVAVVAYWVFVQDQFDQLYTNYIEAEYQSAGALVRLAMNAVPAAILLIWHRRFTLIDNEQRIWRWVALLAIALLLAFPIVPSTTALDRLGLFVIPLQLVVFSHLPDVFGQSGRSNQFWVLLVLAYYALVQFVWLNYAAHAFAWLPYQFYPFVGM
ncbi:EpsG family protein [Spiribacter vilamensis]|uniref:EpsG-like putative glucosyltransferase n=1 Tax=Spiribacter vilamensis TaxID=531306 RepID=A0A4V2GJ69_9GAMM|nr:EpsG family protein [Spiribacter vilamensis]RZU99095.1 EpsG-like putative glucosyltransferase [Spiribacter vilamensis]TVO61908.1 EpsG family protein [Spiribacter vilamensis]